MEEFMEEMREKLLRLKAEGDKKAELNKK